MIDYIKKMNPQLVIKEIDNSSFKTYGRIWHENVQEAVAYMEKKSVQNENKYEPSVAELEQLSSIKKLSQTIYGGLPIIVGSVTGKNKVLNGMEYHQGSETIIAITYFILIVGHVWDMICDTYDTSLCEIFFVPKGTIVVCFSTTLHYTPVSVNRQGFKTICILLQGTGDLAEQRNGILKKKNKWFIAHPENLEKIQAGDYPGLLGAMIKINYG